VSEHGSAARLRRPATLAAVGLVATALYALIFAGLMGMASMPAALASILAYAAASAVSYRAHRKLTFAGVQGDQGVAGRFAALAIAGYAASFMAPLVLCDLAGLPLWTGIAAVCLLIPAVNAMALARFVFGVALFGIDAPRAPGEDRAS
jgi:putative flippase GtrA